MHDSGGESRKGRNIHRRVDSHIHMLIIYNYNLQCMELTTQGTG